MTVPSVKQVFFETSEKFGGRDCNIMGISALKGWVAFLQVLSPVGQKESMKKRPIHVFYFLLLSIFHVDWNLEIETDKYSKQFILSVCLIVFFISINREGVREGILWLVESIKNNSVVRPPMQKEITWPWCHSVATWQQMVLSFPPTLLSSV